MRKVPLSKEFKAETCGRQLSLSLNFHKQLLGGGEKKKVFHCVRLCWVGQISLVLK